MNLGKTIRLNRLFSHPSGKFFSVAVDHFISYNKILPEPLYNLKETVDQIVSGGPDAVTMHFGIANKIWINYAGQIPLIIQSTLTRPDDSAFEIIATPEDAARSGADAYAIVGYVRGDSETEYLTKMAKYVREAERFEIPIICHIYPRDFSSGSPKISYKPEDVAWAVHCAMEVGVDVIKTPYCGDIAAFSQIIDQSSVPVVCAGGPKKDDFKSSLEMIADVMKSGAKGATIGRNVWGSKDAEKAVLSFKEIIHKGSSVDQTIGKYGLD